MIIILIFYLKTGGKVKINQTDLRAKPTSCRFFAKYLLVLYRIYIKNFFVNEFKHIRT